MAITFQKRQKEFKRLEKQREKAERRAQKKMTKRAEGERPADGTDPLANPEDSELGLTAEPQSAVETTAPKGADESA